MEYIHIKQGNLLDATEDYIAHQCNCVSNNAHALAKQLFDRYPYADTYKKRIDHSQPGTIDVFYNNPNASANALLYQPRTCTPSTTLVLSSTIVIMKKND